tara:strand:- start:15694 stop:15870 length:177 start_codon:yes stop_codon:yes gene_type:complete
MKYVEVLKYREKQLKDRLPDKHELPKRLANWAAWTADPTLYLAELRVYVEGFNKDAPE